MRFRAVVVVLGLLLVSPAVCADAQQQSRTATVSVLLTVLPQASFQAESERPMSADVVPGERVQIAPSAGVRTRLTYSASAQVRVSGGPLIWPGGAELPVRFVCAFGGGMTVSASDPFDCADGVLTATDGVRLTTIPLAVGAELSARTTRDTKAGLYGGRVVITATYPTY